MRTYEVRTYGCQMNVHDSERLSGLLESAGYVAPCRRRAGRRRGVQHLRGARERRQPALRQPRPPHAGEGRAPGHADRRRRLHGAEGPRRGRTPCPVGRRRLRHPQHRLAAGAARARARQRRGAGRDRRVARGVPLDAADAVASRRTPRGCRSASAATTPARSASCRACAARRRTAAPATCSPRSRRSSARACSRSRCSGQNVNAYGVEFGDRAAFAQAAARVRRDRRPRAGALHQPAPGRLHRRRHRRDGRDAERHAAAAHAAAERHRTGCSRRCAAPTAASATSASSTASAPRCPTRRSPPTSSSASRARPTTTSSRRSTSCGRRGSRRAFTFQYSPRPGTPAATYDATRCRPRSCKERYSGCARSSSEIAWDENKQLVGRRVEVLVAEGEGRKDGATHAAVRPRARQPAGALHARSRRRRGRATWSSRRSPTRRRTTWSPTCPSTGVRRTRAGDAWLSRQSSAADGVPSDGGSAPVLLGLPTIRT